MSLWLAQNEAPSTEFLYLARCNACPLKQLHTKGEIKSWAIPPRGSKHPNIYVLGLGPGPSEDEEGRFFVGKTGKLLKECLSNVEITNIRFNNITRTRDLDNNPSKIAIEACRKFIEEDIVATKPKVILGLGGLVLHWIVGYDLDETITNWRRRKIPVRFSANGETHICWFVPTIHPASILRTAPSFADKVPKFQDRTKEEAIDEFKKDLKFAKELFASVPNETDFDVPDVDSFELINGKYEQAIDALKYFSSVSHVALDLETTGLRPYGSNSKILSLGLSDQKRNTAIILEHPESKWTTSELHKLWVAIKEFWNSDSRKIAHNMPFEFEWLAHRLGNIRHDHIDDTLAMAFVFDERRVLRLDVLCLLYFGFRLKSLSPDIHIDKLENDPWEIVSRYNVLDCFFEHKLFFKLKQEIEKADLTKIYKEQVNRIPSFALMQIKGLDIDQNRAKELSTKYAAQIQLNLMRIYSDPDFTKQTQKIKGLTPTSPDKVKHLFNNLGFPIQKADENALNTVSHPLAPLIVKLREYQKMKGTYIDSFIQSNPDTVVWPDGKIHPQYSLTFVVTGRTCVAQGTYIELPSNLTQDPFGKKIEDIQVGDLVYSYDDDLFLTLKPVRWVGKTGHKPVLRIHWNARGNKKTGFVDLTPDHEIRMIDGSYKTVEKLEVGDRVLSLSRVIVKSSRKRQPESYLYSTGIEASREHRLVSRILHGHPRGREVHHKDGNHLNNSPENLELLEEKVHLRYHALTDNLNKINSKFALLRTLVTVKGEITKLPYDFNSFKRKLARFGIDHVTIKQRLQSKHNHTISKIEILPDAVDVYDLEVEDTHNFIGGGICLHNSSTAPNIQNEPKHGNSEPRSIIVPPKGYAIVSADYKQIEFRGIGIVSNDASLCDMIKHKYDVHMDWAKKIAILYPAVINGIENLKNPEMMKEYRDTAKQNFVFAKCYGAGPEKTAETLHIPLSVAQELDRMFWQQLPGVKAWQRYTYKFYDEHGYVENLLGRRRHWFKKKTEIINFPIQSLASDIVIDTMNRFITYAEIHNKPQFIPMMEIHDDIEFYIPLESLDEDIETIGQTMINVPYDFINVPLAVDIATSTTTWEDLKSVKTYESRHGL